MHIQRSVLGLLAGSVVLLVVGVVVAIATTRQPAASYQPGSPEATVAEFVRLIEDGELDEAYELTAIPGLSRERFQEQFNYRSETSRRVTLVRSDVEGEEATVVVDITTFSSGDTLGGSDYSYRETYRLRRESGRWLITSPEYFRL